MPNQSSKDTHTNIWNKLNSTYTKDETNSTINTAIAVEILARDSAIEDAVDEHDVKTDAHSNQFNQYTKTTIADAKYVGIYSDQDIEGEKNFTTTPTIDSKDIATEDYVDDELDTHNSSLLAHNGLFVPASLQSLIMFTNNTQNVSGTKNYVGVITVPDQDLGDKTTKAANTKFVNSIRTELEAALISHNTSELAHANKVSTFLNMPTAQSILATLSGTIVIYRGATTSEFTHGYVYQVIYDVSVDPKVYKWERIDVQPIQGEAIPQYEVLPDVRSTPLDTIGQYSGTDTAEYTKGYFYQLVENTTATWGKSWERIDVQPIVYVDEDTLTKDIYDTISIKDHGITTDKINETTLDVSTESLYTTDDTHIPTSKLVYETIIDAKRGFTFKGYVSPTAPTGSIRDKELWYQNSTTVMPTPPFDVFTYNGTTWSTITTSYTPGSLDLWSNKNNDNGYYWFGNDWNLIDFNVDVDNDTIDHNNLNQLEVKDGGLTVPKFKADSISKTIPTDNTSVDTKIPTEKAVEDALDTKITHYKTMPIANVSYLNEIVQYVGTSGSGYDNGFFYKCIEDTTNPGTYKWIVTLIQNNKSNFVALYNKTAESIKGSDTNAISQKDINVENVEAINSRILQVSTMPTADVTNKDKIIEYIGTTTTTAPIYTNGYFYKCVADTATGIYSWNEWKVQKSVNKTSEVEIDDRSAESIKGDSSLADYQKDINIENVAALKERIVQVETMPDASLSEWNNKIVCYKGTDTSVYKVGHLYKKRTTPLQGYEVEYEKPGSSIFTAYANTSIMGDGSYLYSDKLLTTQIADKYYADAYNVYIDSSKSSNIGWVNNKTLYTVEWEEVYTVDLSGYLPLNGGTMTGTITTGTDAPMIIDNSGGAKITTTNDDNVLKIVGSTAVGSSITLTGGNEGSYHGGFEIEAKNDTEALSLVGKPDGTLAWGINDVITTANGIYRTATMPDPTSTEWSDKIICYSDETTTTEPIYTKGHLYKSGDKTYHKNIIQTTIGIPNTVYSKTAPSTGDYITAYSDSACTIDSGYVLKTPYMYNASTLSNVGRINESTPITVTGWVEVYVIDTTDYLPIAGGTMEGSISTSNVVNPLIVDNDGIEPAIKTTTDGSSLTIKGCSSVGSSITLSGKDSSYGGEFHLITTDGTTANTKELIGKSDGTLTWNTNDIITLDKAIYRSSTIPTNLDTKYQSVIVCYDGTDTTDFKKGHLYKYYVDTTPKGYKIEYTESSVAVTAYASMDFSAGNIVQLYSDKKRTTPLSPARYANYSGVYEDASGSIVVTTSLTPTMFMDDPAWVEVYTTDISGYLPIAGGNMEGDIAMGNHYITCDSIPTADNHLVNKGYTEDTYLRSDGDVMEGPLTIGSQSSAFINKSVDDGCLTINGATDGSNGATLLLYGKDQSVDPGEFKLYARKDGSYSYLIGTPEGSLTWNDNDVLTLDKSIYRTSTVPTSLESKYQNDIICYSGNDTDTFKKGCLYKYVIGLTGYTISSPDLGGTDLYSEGNTTGTIYSLYTDKERTTEAYVYFKAGDGIYYDPECGSLITNNYTATSYDTSTWTGVYEDVSKYLPLAGGIMTGTIRLDPNSRIYKTNSSSLLALAGSSDEQSGACLFLYGQAVSLSPGDFKLRASKSSGSVQTELKGTAAGSLTWGGNDVITTSNGDNRYLKSAGGTMTGKVYFSATDAIYSSLDTSYLIVGGSASTSGTRLQLNGINRSVNPGYFTLYTTNQAGDTCNLIGTPAGALTWGENDISGKLIDYTSTLTKASGVSGNYKLFGVGRMRILYMDQLKTTGSNRTALFTLSVPCAISSISSYNAVFTTSNQSFIIGIERETLSTIYIYAYTANTAVFGSLIYFV